MARYRRLSKHVREIVEKAAARGWSASRTRGDHLVFERDGCPPVLRQAEDRATPVS